MVPSAWKDLIHNAFENAAATRSSVESAYRALKEKGKVQKIINSLPLAARRYYDIGFQSLQAQWRETAVTWFGCLLR